MNQNLAQILRLPTIVTSLGAQPPVEIVGPLPAGRFESLGDIVGTLLQYLFPLAGFLMFLLIIVGGFQWLTSAGDPKKVESAAKRVTAAVVGFILLFASYWLVKILNLILSPDVPWF